MTGYFGEDKEKINGVFWNWSKFKSTKGFPIPEELMEWVIGQDKALVECKLCIDEWIQKLLHLKEKKWWKDFEPVEEPTYFTVKIRNRVLFKIKTGTKLVFKAKPPPKEWLPSGPFLFMAGDAGTGKSLIGRALSTYMTKLYKEKGIELNDVLAWKNEVNPSEPKISIHPAGKGKKLSLKLRLKALKKNRFMKWGFRLLQGMMMGFGITIIGLVLYFIGSNWLGNAITQFGVPVQEFYNGDFLRYLIDQFMTNAMIFYMGIGAISMGAMLFIFKSLIGRVGRVGGVEKGGGGAESLDSPKLIIDNSSGKAPFIDATGHTTQQLFGSISWTPFGTAGPPEHQRVVAGAVHRAHLGILYIDEIKNLIGSEAVTLLTVLEDGQLPITLRSQIGGAGGSAEMAVSTEPVPCMTFLVAAGNLDSIPQIHYALMDRIAGYGKVVYMNNDMPNTVKNRRKYIQFIAQEIKRFNLLPFSRGACVEVIEESRRRAGRIDRLATKFRPMISIIKTAGVLAFNEDKKIVESKHVKEAIEEHCKSIELQVMEKMAGDANIYRIIVPQAEPKIGQIHGVGVVHGSSSSEMVGTILPIHASVIPVKKRAESYFNVTGVDVSEQSWIQQSILKIRHIFNQKYGKDLEDDFKTHIDFAQMKGVEGPSAGVAMVLALMSAIDGRPIRQDVVVTGEINIVAGCKGRKEKVIITSVGGVHTKILAAQQWGFKKVLIPARNFKYNINPKDYKIKVVGCKTLADYVREILGDKQNGKSKD